MFHKICVFCLNFSFQDANVLPRSTFANFNSTKQMKSSVKPRNLSVN